MPFVDRIDAGRRLAGRLRHLRGSDLGDRGDLGDRDDGRENNLVVLGLPRGGVPVAFEVARALSAPLDVIVVRKLGVPFQPELAMGAVGEDGVLMLNDRVVKAADVSERELNEAIRRERAEVAQRAREFRGDRPRLSLVGRTAVVIDDGVATGATARAACQVARAHGAAKVILALPVCSSDAVELLKPEVDELICLEVPRWFLAVGQFYRDFGQTSDREVVDLLGRAQPPSPTGGAAPGPGDPLSAAPLRDEDVTVAAGTVRLAGHLTVPQRPRGAVIFAHGSGSSRHSPRNRYVARVLQRAGLATLLFDLLSPAEESSRGNVFNIDLLARRLNEVCAWMRAQPECANLPIGYFGASTGAAAALRASTAPEADIASVVSRGGRPDLAGDALSEVRAPTLLIVGGRDELVLELNRQAQAALRCESRLVVIPGATHLFSEPGTLEQAAALASDWFVSHMSRIPETSG